MKNLVNVCVDSYAGQEISGRFYTLYSVEPTSFTGITSFLLRLEQFYDRLGFPMASTRHRRFAGEDTKKEKMSVIENNYRFGNKGEQASFILHVQFRQNSSWQGVLHWMEANKKVSFRSALELIRLIDGANNIDGTWDNVEEICALVERK